VEYRGKKKGILMFAMLEAIVIRRNQRIGKEHLKYISGVAVNVCRNTQYKLGREECIREALRVHRNYLRFMEARRIER
jgi:hypothetical protein